jgi:hypothetical protein
MGAYNLAIERLKKACQEMSIEVQPGTGAIGGDYPGSIKIDSDIPEGTILFDTPLTSLRLTLWGNSTRVASTMISLEALFKPTEEIVRTFDIELRKELHALLDHRKKSNRTEFDA